MDTSPPHTPMKPSSPPPAYTELADPFNPQSSANASQGATSPGRANYGPTPLAQQQIHLLPYYDPSSPHSVTEARTRARLRFIGAVLWAWAILAFAGIVMGFEGRMQHRMPHGRLPGP